jgi:hypothetical protein
LQLVGPSALFWRSVESFEVLHQSEVIAQCPTVNDTCAIFIP